jgi:8-oxo-dGTP pyrophosphatase MutT (NUDIX family)
VSALTLRSAGDPLLAPSADLAVAEAHVRAIPPGDAVREAFRTRTLDLVAAHPDALDRTCQPGHLTGSALVVDPATRRVLVLLHAKLRIWVQPGGHADGDAALPGVALKEATEETGIAGLRVATPALDIDIHPIPPPHGPVLHHDLRYLVVAPPGAEPVRNHESLDIAWVRVEELDRFGVDESTVRLAHSGLVAFDELVAAGRL